MINIKLNDEEIHLIQLGLATTINKHRRMLAGQISNSLRVHMAAKLTSLEDLNGKIKDAKKSKPDA